MDDRSPTKRFYDEIHALATDFHAQREEIANLKVENERLKSTIEAIYRIDPLLKEAVASAMLAAKEGKSV